MKRPFEIYVIFMLLFILSVNALLAGGMMIVSPSGSGLGLPLDWISGTPFKSYIIPGILLFCFLGMLPFVTLIGLIFKIHGGFLEKLNIYPEMHWAWTFSLYSGIITIIWIIVQQLLTKYFILQPIVAGTGLLMVILALIPRIQQWYRTNGQGG